MDVVLPISVTRRRGEKSDLLRLKILCASMRKFWRSEDTLHVITPDPGTVAEELARIGFDAVVVHDDVVFDRIPNKLHPWWRQQLLKLAAHKLVSTEFYLVLDADCFFVRETSDADLILNGRGRVSFGEGSAYSHRNWYRGCARLGLAIPPRHINVTPFVMHSGLARQAFELVSDRPESIGRMGWSEYTLYHCVGEQNGSWDQHHVEAEPFLGGAVWMKADLDTWKPSELFGRDFHLSLVQSNTCVSAEVVWAALQPYLT